MAIGFNIQFRINEKTQSRVIRLTDTSTGFTFAKGNFSIVHPDGSSIIHTDFNNPDISIAGSSYEFQASTDIYNNVLTGQYTITYVALSTSGQDYTITRSFDFNWIKPSADIQNRSDVFIPQVQFFDNTSYITIGSFTGTLTRNFSVPFPSTSEVPNQPTAFTSTNTLTPLYQLKCYEGLYNLSLDVTVNYTHAYSWLTIYYTNLSTKTFDIRQVPNQVQLVTKINTFRAVVDSYREKNDTQFEILSEEYDIAIALYSHLIARFETGTLDGSQPLLEELLSILEPYTGAYTYKATQLTPFVLNESGGQSFNVSDGINLDVIPMQSTLVFSAGNPSLNILVTNNAVTFTPIFGSTSNTFAAGNDGRFHDNVTIGTANGLSLSTQVLSLALASSGSAGAMSAADKTKLDGVATGATANVGTVTSVGISMPSAFTVTNSPVTTSGTLTIVGAGSSLQYIKGDGGLATLNTAAVAESTNLYFTTGRSRSSVSLTTTGTSGAATYNPTTGVFNIPQYTGNVTSFNTRTGDIVLSSSDVTTALTFTPYNATNPSGYISGITGVMVTSALGYTPYNATNPAGYITGITSGNVTTALGYTPENAANKGIANGYASLDGGGLIPSTQLPSYVDDVLEYTNLAGFPATGTTGKIYVALDDNKIYRWSGTTYIEVSPTVGTIWGGITGTLSNQTDLQTALNAKQATLSGTGFVKSTSGTISYDTTTYYPYPLGTTSQYVAGDGSLIAFPVAGQAGTLVRLVRNQTGATITKGTVVYISGATGNNPIVAKAIATGDSTSAQTFGLCQSDISNNATGYVVTSGDLAGLDTSAFTEGQQVYLSPTTAGTFTATKQYAPNHLVYIGVITRSHPTLGQIEVKIQNGYEMDELHNVSAQTPSNNDGLFWETATSLWKNKSIATVLGYTPANAARTLTINGTAYDLTADRTWSVGTVTSVAALTLGTTGTDLSSSVASGTTTPVITLNVPTASATNRGALSAADWTTFNNKQNALTNPVTGTGTTNYIPKFTSASTLGNSIAYIQNNEFVIQGTTYGAMNVRSASGNANYLFFTENGVADRYLLGSPTGSGDLVFRSNSYDFSSGTERMRITSAGNVGIGTTTINVGGWTKAVTLQGSANAAYEVTDGTVRLATFVAASTIGGVSVETNHPLGFYTNSTERMRLTSGGNLLVGTTTDSGYKLDVNGTGRFASTWGASTSNPFLVIERSGGAVSSAIGYDNTNTGMYFGTTTSHRLALRTNNTDVLVLASSGSATFSSSVTATSFRVNTNGSGITFTNTGGSASGQVYQTGADYLALLSGGSGIQFKASSGANLVTLTESGNLGLGVTPSAWGITPALQVVNASLYNQGDDGTYITSNGYYNAGWKYIGTSTATQYQMLSGQHRWYNAPSGTAGTAISFTQAMTLNASGNLSIGNTNDTYKLDVSGTGRFTGSVQEMLYVNSSVTSGTVFRLSNTSTGGGDFRFYSTGSGNGEGAGRLVLNFNGSYALLNISGSTGAATFSSSVTAGGGFKFTGATWTNQASTGGVDYASGVRFYSLGANTTTKSGFEWHTNSSDGSIDVTAMRLDASGNLGLGVTPSAWGVYKAYQVGYGAIASYNDADTAIFSNAYFDGGTWRYIGSSYASQYRQLSSTHSWHIAPYGTAGTAISFTQAMTLDASGNLLLGATANSQGAKLKISGGYVYLNETGGADVYFRSAFHTNKAAIQVESASDLVFATSNLIRMTLTSGGNVLIGTTTDSGYKLDVSGTGYFTGTLYAMSTSTAIYVNGGYIYTVGRYTNSNSGNILSNNGTGTNLLIGETATNFYGIGGGTLGGVPTNGITLNTSTGAATFSSSVTAGGSITQSSSSATLILNRTGGTTYGAGVQYQTSGTNNWIVGTGQTTVGTDYQIYNYNTGSGAIAIGYNSNYVGIGVTSPANRLQIGSVGSTGYGGNDFVIGNGTNVFAIYQNDTATNIYATKPFSFQVSNVLIGTTTDAGYKLDVNGTGRYSGNVTVGLGNALESLLVINGQTYSGLRFQRAGTTKWAIFNNNAGTDFIDFYNYTTSSSAFYISSTNAATFLSSVTATGVTAASTSGGTISITTNSAAGSYASPIYTDINFLGYNNSNKARIRSWSVDSNSAEGILSFWTNSSANSLAERMRITEAGNVGIGTTSPGSILETYAAIPVIKINGTTLDGDRGVEFQHNSENLGHIKFNAQSGGLKLSVGKAGFGSFISFTADTTERMRITSGGNVGIGTTSPVAALDVSGNATLVANFNYASNGTYVRWQNNGTSFGDIGSGSSLISGGSTNDFTVHARSTYNLLFATNFTERMRITSGGNVSIGESNTGEMVQKLHVNGSINISSGYLRFQNGNAQISISTYDLIFSTFNAGLSERMRITSGGNVLIGTTTDSGYKLNVNGTIYAAGGGFSTPASEAGFRLKMYDNGGVNNDPGIGLDGAGGAGEVMWFNAYSGFYFNYGTNGAKVKFDASGNVGIGVTPSAWSSNNSTLQLKNGVISSATFGTTTFTWLGSNWYNDGTSDKFIVNGKAALISVVNGSLVFNYTSYDGVAGDTISFTQALRIANTGNVLIGTNTDSGYKLNVNGSGYFAGNLNYNSGTAIYPRTTSVGDWYLLKHNSAYDRIENGLGVNNPFTIGSQTTGYTPNIFLYAGGTSTFNGAMTVNSSVTATSFSLSALNTAPASATATGTTGEVRIDASYIYVCTATNTWKRATLSTW